MNAKLIVLVALVSLVPCIWMESEPDQFVVICLWDDLPFIPILQVGFALAVEQQQQQQQQVRKGRQAGVPEGLVLTQRVYPKNNNGAYVPDNSGKYFPRNVKYIHVAGQKSATAVNIGSGQKGSYHSAATGQYVPENSGRYSAGGSGNYNRGSEGQYVRSKSEGKYPIMRLKTNSVTSAPDQHPLHSTTKQQAIPPTRPIHAE